MMKASPVQAAEALGMDVIDPDAFALPLTFEELDTIDCLSYHGARSAADLDDFMGFDEGDAVRVLTTLEAAGLVHELATPAGVFDVTDLACALLPAAEEEPAQAAAERQRLLLHLRLSSAFHGAPEASVGGALAAVCLNGSATYKSDDRAEVASWRSQIRSAARHARIQIRTVASNDSLVAMAYLADSLTCGTRR